MRELQTLITDDIASEPGVLAVVTDVPIGIRGHWYLVDLGEDSLKLINDLFKVIRQRGRPIEELPSPSARKGMHLPRAGYLTSDDGVMSRDAAKAHRDRMRQWANTQPQFAGQIKRKGYIPMHIRRAYDEAQGG